MIKYQKIEDKFDKEMGDIEKEWRLFENPMMLCAEVYMRRLGSLVRKGSE